MKRTKASTLVLEQINQHLLFMVVCWIIMWFCTKQNIKLPDDTTMLIIAILTAGEVISWRCKR